MYLTVDSITDTTITANSDGKLHDISVVQTGGNNDNPAIRLSMDLLMMTLRLLVVLILQLRGTTINFSSCCRCNVDETVDDV